jgi:hypothetical protein
VLFVISSALFAPHYGERLFNALRRRPRRRRDVCRAQLEDAPAQAPLTIAPSSMSALEMRGSLHDLGPKLAHGSKV